MPLEGFSEAIANRVLVCDGAMGTMLYAGGAFMNRPFDELNLTNPELVEGVHRAYVEAGANVIETNTFGANRHKFETFGLEQDVAAINRAGVQLAREAAGDRAYVAGAIGPLGTPSAPDDQTMVDEAKRCAREQIEILADAGVDLIMLETYRSCDELVAAVTAVRTMTNLPVVAQFTTVEDGNAPDGVCPEVFASRLADAGATVVGVNCGCGPAEMMETVQRLSAVTSIPLAAQPNAGSPRQLEGRTMYLSSPEFVASYARRFIGLGVQLVGGCCGTTPDHIRRVATSVLQPS